MADGTGYQVDLDEEKVLFEDKWVGRKDLAERIRKMIESQDYRISSAGAALEYLETSLSGSRSLKVKLTGTDAEAVAQHADRAGIPVSKFLRQAIQAYLASQPPLDDQPAVEPAPPAGPVPIGPGPAAAPPGLVPLGRAKPAGEPSARSAQEAEPEAKADEGGGQTSGQVLTTITTEPAEPGEADQAVELVSKKPAESSKVVVDPSLAPEGSPKPNPNAIGDSWFKKS